MYTWGYIKEASLAKLDLTSKEAIETGLMNKFPFYANEAMTQICSSVKAKATYGTFLVYVREEYYDLLRRKFGLPFDYDFSFLNLEFCKVEDLPIAPYNEQDMWHHYHDNNIIFTNEIVPMPTDFVSFGDDINRRFSISLEVHSTIPEIATDDDWNTIGSNNVMFLRPGKYMISYYARWYFFTPKTQDNEKLDIPADVVDAIPSYIVSQCYKIDDESKANVYRTEFELFLARIEDNNARTNKVLHLSGGW